MAAAGSPLLLPFLVLNVVLDSVWFLYGLFLAPYGLVMGLGVEQSSLSGLARPCLHLIRAVPSRRRYSGLWLGRPSFMISSTMSLWLGGTVS